MQVLLSSYLSPIEIEIDRVSTANERETPIKKKGEAKFDSLSRKDVITIQSRTVPYRALNYLTLTLGIFSGGVAIVGSLNYVISLISESPSSPLIFTVMKVGLAALIALDSFAARREIIRIDSTIQFLAKVTLTKQKIAQEIGDSLKHELSKIESNLNNLKLFPVVIDVCYYAYNYFFNNDKSGNKASGSP